MKSSDPIQFVESGSLVRPGPIGRSARFGLGSFCLYAFWGIVVSADVIINTPLSALPSRITLLLAPMCVYNYVVNIGFSKNWGKRPLVLSLALLTVSALAGMITSGGLNNPIFGGALFVWLGYFYAHLGVSFALSAFIATPGCEMRAIPELFGRIRGIPSEEHRCPVFFLTKIDEWERGLKSR